MGTWGSGNLENDAALDMVGDLLDPARKKIDAFRTSGQATIEDLEEVMACIFVHLVLHDQCAMLGPQRAQADALRTKVLGIYDREIDDLDPDPDYKTERRAVLAETLDRYVAASQGDNG